MISNVPAKMLRHHNLVGGIPTPLKNIKVSWDDDILQYIESHEKSMVSNHQSAS